MNPNHFSCVSPRLGCQLCTWEEEKRLKERGVCLNCLHKAKKAVPSPASTQGETGMDVLNNSDSGINCADCDTLESSSGPRLCWCLGCKSVYYCSKDCQIPHWAIHKVRVSLFLFSHSPLASNSKKFERRTRRDQTKICRVKCDPGKIVIELELTY
jgi:hypothetical protein